MASRSKKRQLTKEEWVDFAKTLQNSINELQHLYDLMLLTTTVEKSEIVRSAIRKANIVWNRSEEICGNQIDFDFATQIFHGSGWNYMA